MSGCHQKLSEAAAAVGGRLHGNDGSFDGVSTDTRSVSKRQLFVALVGPNFDAHEFIKEALDKGAAGVLVQHKLEIDAPQIVVSDTQLALARLATAWRQQFSIPVIAVTGSNGKTTVKEMMASILDQQGCALATQGNLNNEIGVPLTLLRLTSVHTAAVIEEGASHPGDIRYLTQCAQPTVAVVTNAAGAHLEGFGSLDAVARTKGELFENLPDNGIAIINTDDAYHALWQSLAGNRKVITFGFSAGADVRGVIEKTVQGQEGSKVCRLNMITPAGECLVLVPLIGRHNAMNALAATAAALAAGVTLEVIKRGLESVKPVPGRLQWKSGVNNARIIDDTYNANPASLAVALDVLADCAGDHYLALGDMAELGGEAENLHEQAGRQARDSGVHRLYTIGKYARLAAQAFGDQGCHFSAQDQLINQLRDDMNENVTLLVKGSRSSRMDKVVDALVPRAMGGAG